MIASGISTSPAAAKLLCSVPVRRVMRAAFAAALGAAVSLSFAPARAYAQKPPEPEPLSLTTSDGVSLGATYYAPANAGKDTPVVVILHMYGKDQRSWPDVAEALRAKAIAALTVDLRGHGESTTQAGRSRKLDPKAFRRNDYVFMVTRDMEAVKGELVRRHNAGQLNIERLGVVGAEMGASIAVNWAYWDWTNANGQRPDYATVEGGKRGRDVKSLVLFSPQYNFKGLRITPVQQQLMASRLNVLILSGSESREHRDAVRMWKSIARDEKDENHLIFTYRTKLQGSGLLSEELTPLAKDRVAEFMQRTLLTELRGPEITWKPRVNAFGELQSQ
jgi:pimeloyl-ACP methyl ester carboxylesterase